MRTPGKVLKTGTSEVFSKRCMSLIVSTLTDAAVSLNLRSVSKPRTTTSLSCLVESASWAKQFRAMKAIKRVLEKVSFKHLEVLKIVIIH